MEQLLFTNKNLTPEKLWQSKHVQCSTGEMFESAPIVGICGSPWKQLLQNFWAFIDQFKRRPYYHFLGGKNERHSWTLTEYLSSDWEAILYLQELSFHVVSRYQISFTVAVQVRGKNVKIAESLALAFRSQFWDIFHLLHDSDFFLKVLFSVKGSCRILRQPIGVGAIFHRVGGGGGGKPFVQKLLARCPNFYKPV